MLDGAILAGDVDRLQRNEHQPALITIGPFLQVVQTFHAGLQRLSCVAVRRLVSSSAGIPNVSRTWSNSPREVSLPIAARPFPAI